MIVISLQILNKKKKLILSWKSRWLPSSNTWFCFVFSYIWILPAFPNLVSTSYYEELAGRSKTSFPGSSPTRPPWPRLATVGHGGSIGEDPGNEVGGSKPFRNGAIFWMNNNKNEYIASQITTTGFFFKGQITHKTWKNKNLLILTVTWGIRWLHCFCDVSELINLIQPRVHWARDTTEQGKRKQSGKRWAKSLLQ